MTSHDVTSHHRLSLCLPSPQCHRRTHLDPPPPPPTCRLVYHPAVLWSAGGFISTRVLSTPLSGPDKPCQRRLRGLATCRVGVCRTRDRLPGIINTGYTAASQATRPACGCSDRRRRRRRLAGVRLQLCLYVVGDWCRSLPALALRTRRRLLLPVAVKTRVTADRAVNRTQLSWVVGF